MTPLQIRIIAGLARGHTQPVIARDLSMSEDTLKREIQHAARTAGIRCAYPSAALVDHAYLAGLMAGLLPEERPPVELTRRMRDVMPGLVAGDSSSQIAAALGLSVWTVKTHIKRLYAVLGARSRPHAVALIRQLGLLDAEAERVAA